MEITETLYIDNRLDWRTWLEQNYLVKDEIWLIYYKKHTGRPRIKYDDAVEEALCFGWIDSTVKRVDNEVYVQRFTPRNLKSNWSELNKRRVRNLVSSGLMTEHGYSFVKYAKKTGEWYKDDNEKFEIPEYFIILLKKNPKANLFFISLTEKQQQQYIRYIAQAKQEKTIIRRSDKAIQMLNENKKVALG